MNKTNTKLKFTFILILPLVASMLITGLNQINANNIQPDQGIINDQTIPVMGFAQITINGQILDGDNIFTEGYDNDYIPFYTYRHEITRDSASSNRGQGKIVSSPIIITKAIDKTSPLFATAFTQASPVNGFFLFFEFSQSSSNILEERYKIEFDGGQVTSIRTFTVITDTGSVMVEEISFIFARIIWMDLVNNIESSMDLVSLPNSE